jgi:hypothetical protein
MESSSEKNDGHFASCCMRNDAVSHHFLGQYSITKQNNTNSILNSYPFARSIGVPI